MNAGIEGTAAQETVADAVPETPAQVESKPEERMFTRDEVNKLMQRRVERSHNAVFTRYGVANLEELDNLFGQANSYGPLKEKFGELEKNHNDLNSVYKDLQKRYAFKVGNIDEKRINDIETYFKGKNIDIDENTLAQELKSHPEWVKKVGQIQAIGAEATPAQEMDEREMAEKYFGVKLSRKRS